MFNFNVPSIEQLREFPELAPLAILDNALQASIMALLSTHELGDPDGDSPNDSLPTTPAGWAADTIVVLAESLRHALTNYRQATSRQLTLNLIRTPTNLAF